MFVPDTPYNSLSPHAKKGQTPRPAEQPAGIIMTGNRVSLSIQFISSEVTRRDGWHKLISMHKKIQSLQQRWVANHVFPVTFLWTLLQSKCLCVGIGTRSASGQEPWSLCEIIRLQRKTQGCSEVVCTPRRCHLWDSIWVTLYWESEKTKTSIAASARAVIMAHLENCALSTGGRKRKGTHTQTALAVTLGR